MTRSACARVIAVADQLGPVLSGRSAGALLREQIEELARQQGEVVVDFSGVELATPGFADELFAKIDSSLVDTRRVRFTHLGPNLSVLRNLVVVQRRRA